MGSFSYTSHDDVNFIWGVSLTHPVLGLVLSTDLLLHIPCWFYIYRGSFSYTSRAGFSFYQLRFSYTSRAGFFLICGVFLTYPMRALFFCGKFLLHIPCWLLFLIRGVSLTHPVLFSFLSAESLFNIPCSFIFIWGVSLTHPMLTLFLYGEFLLHIPR